MAHGSRAANSPSRVSITNENAPSSWARPWRMRSSQVLPGARAISWAASSESVDVRGVTRELVIG